MMNPRVRRVSASSDYKLHLEFTNGERGVYDCSPQPTLVVHAVAGKNIRNVARVIGVYRFEIIRILLVRRYMEG